MRRNRKRGWVGDLEEGGKGTDLVEGGAGGERVEVGHPVEEGGEWEIGVVLRRMDAQLRFHPVSDVLHLHLHHFFTG